MSWPTVVVCLVWALVTWDMVRRYAGKVATQALRAELGQLRAEFDELKAGPRLKELEQRAAHLSTLVESRRAGNTGPRRLGGL